MQAQLANTKQQMFTLADKQSVLLQQTLMSALTEDVISSNAIQQNGLVQALYTRFEQQKILADILYSAKPYASHQENLNHLLSAIVFNTSVDPRLKQHQFMLDIDDHLIPNVMVNAELLEQLISQWLREATRLLPHSKVLIKAVIVDQDTGSQTVQFVATVLASKPLSHIPENINKLLTTDTSHDSFLSNYFLILLARFNGKKLSSSLHNEGFQLGFELPFITAKYQPVTKVIRTFVQKSVMIICDNKVIRQTLASHMKRSGARVDSFNQVTQFIQFTRAAKHGVKGVDFVLIASEHQQDVEKLTDFLQENSNSKNVKLFAIQHPKTNRVESV